MKNAKIKATESAWTFVNRVYEGASSGARILICDRLELAQLLEMKKPPYGAIGYLERAIKSNADFLIQS